MPRFFDGGLLTATLIAILACGASGPAACSDLALTGSLGLGGLFPSSPELYGDRSALFYPEARAQFEMPFLRLGARVARIGSTQQEWRLTRCCPEEWERLNYTRAFVPVQGELLLAPGGVPMGSGKLRAYAGFALGAYVATGDNQINELSPEIVLGLDLLFDPTLVYGDLRYSFPETPGPQTGPGAVVQYGNIGAGGVTAVIGVGLRHPFRRNTGS